MGVQGWGQTQVPASTSRAQTGPAPPGAARVRPVGRLRPRMAPPLAAPSAPIGNWPLPRAHAELTTQPPRPPPAALAAPAPGHLSTWPWGARAGMWPEQEPGGKWVRAVGRPAGSLAA